MGEVIDLDALVPEPRKATLGGKEYKLPGDVPMEIFLRQNNAGQTDADGVETTEAIYMERMVQIGADLFAWEYPDEVKDAIRTEVSKHLRARGVRFILQLTRAIYQDQDEKAQSMADAAAAEESGPPQPGEDGTQSSTD